MVRTHTKSQKPSAVLYAMCRSCKVATTKNDLGLRLTRSMPIHLRTAYFTTGTRGCKR